MSKDKARGEQSYKNEELLLALVPVVLEQKGFTQVRVERRGGMKFIDTRTVTGEAVTFWLKQGWPNRDYSAIQFGMFDEPEPENIPAARFVEYVDTRATSAKSKGASYALLVHMVDSKIINYVALRIEDVAPVFNRQIAEWPKRARNTKMPTLYFEDSRDQPEADIIRAVLDREVPLEEVSGVATTVGSSDAKPGSKKITAEIELRMQQQAFRLAVGARCGWQCGVSGTAVRAVLDAAHLPGRDWRLHNKAEDGVLVRTDLHRLLDRGLAEIRDGPFWIAKAARVGDYAQFHDSPLRSPAALNASGNVALVAAEG